MTYALKKVGESFGGDHKKFYDNMGFQSMLSSLFPKNMEIKDGVDGKKPRALVIPFTADLNVSRFDPRMDNSEFTRKTREYWARVTRSFFKDPSERSRDPYFKSFVDVILRDVEGRETLAEIYERFPAINSFSMIDTVISGRAATHVLGSFEGLSARDENLALNPSAFLIVDENGEKLKPKHSQYLHRKRLEGMLSMYKVPRIVSEDEGASLLGVAAVVYPSIMKVSREFQVNGEEFFIGAGAWHNSADLAGNYFDNFKTFMDMIYRGIDFTYKKRYLGTNAEREKEEFNEARKVFLDRAHTVRILDKTSEPISTLNPTPNYDYGNCYETGSHVLHAPFLPEYEKRVRSKICSLPGVRCLEEEKETQK
jgi:hypothetical protein